MSIVSKSEHLLSYSFQHSKSPLIS